MIDWYKKEIESKIGIKDRNKFFKIISQPKENRKWFCKPQGMINKDQEEIKQNVFKIFRLAIILF